MSQLVFNWNLQKIKETKTVIYGLFVLVKFKELNEKKILTTLNDRVIMRKSAPNNKHLITYSIISLN